MPVVLVFAALLSAIFLAFILDIFTRPTFDLDYSINKIVVPRNRYSCVTTVILVKPRNKLVKILERLKIVKRPETNFTFGPSVMSEYTVRDSDTLKNVSLLHEGEWAGFIKVRSGYGIKSSGNFLYEISSSQVIKKGQVQKP